MNIYQAAVTLRTNFAHAGIELGASDHEYVNLYFVMHDALHTYLDCPPSEEYEHQVLSTELLLGGEDCTKLGVDIDVVTAGVANMPAEVVEIMIDFYTGWFNQK